MASLERSQAECGQVRREREEARKTATEAICARDEAVRALQDSEQQYRDLTEALPQLLWLTRPDGWHVYFNQKWCAYTGLTLEESNGHGWNHAFHPDDRQRAWERWKQATETGEAYEIEYRLRRADGSYHWVLGRALPLCDASGQVVKWFGTCTDIDDQKRAVPEVHAPIPACHESVLATLRKPRSAR
ncbi:PAS domain-containing protein [Paraburkholderia sp. BL6665CI2N2]|uniref:PAS domain-containing protein n=1 Tax=Paraburkholderia sp. BL6665CI2N2 TaxID=1938806 RepID=UPI0014170897|nr:PAS domain-containing protein [Paraburkholderia sp. BL6665CI2N2]